MGSTFSVLIETELKKRNMSVREAAKEIGISHTTLIGARDGTRITDTKTVMKIAEWLGVPYSTIVEGANPLENQKNKAMQAVAIILHAAPELEQVFTEAASELEAGRLTIGDFNDVVEFAAYKIQKRRAEALRDGN